MMKPLPLVRDRPPIEKTQKPPGRGYSCARQWSQAEDELVIHALERLETALQVDRVAIRNRICDMTGFRLQPMRLNK